VVEENSRGLSDTVANAMRQLEVSKREHWEQFEELTLLQTQGSEPCLAIVDLPWVRKHLSEIMRAAALRDTEMA
jgi:hypothetical protein